MRFLVSWRFLRFRLIGSLAGGKGIKPSGTEKRESVGSDASKHSSAAAVSFCRYCSTSSSMVPTCISCDTMAYVSLGQTGGEACPEVSDPSSVGISVTHVGAASRREHDLCPATIVAPSTTHIRLISGPP